MEIPGQHPNQPAASPSFACFQGFSPSQTTSLLAHPLKVTLEMQLDPIRLPGLAIKMTYAQERDNRDKVREANQSPGVEDLIRSKYKRWARETSLPALKSDRIRQNLLSKAGGSVFEVQDEPDLCTHYQTRASGS